MAQSFLDQAGLPLGLRNNNPGNLRPLPGGVKWIGELPSVNNFSRFTNVEYGLRAMITDITGDIVKDKKDTLRKLITEYAPPGDNNNTAAYINSVAANMGISPDAKLTPSRQTLEKLIRAKMIVELGKGHAGKISDVSINNGFALLSNQVKGWIGQETATETAVGVGGLLVLAGLLYWAYK